MYPNLISSGTPTKAFKTHLTHVLMHLNLSNIHSCQTFGLFDKTKYHFYTIRHILQLVLLFRLLEPFKIYLGSAVIWQELKD